MPDARKPIASPHKEPPSPSATALSRRRVSTALAATAVQLGLTRTASAATSVEQLQQQFLTLTAQHGVRQAVLLFRHGHKIHEWTVGPVKPGSPFLLASITKPMTAIAVMQLVAAGNCRLQDPISKFLPACTGEGRETITLHQALTHTSGLPDMLPENDTLRKQHAPLSAFVSAACKTPLLFPPGSECRYQSMGILLAAAVVEKLSGLSLPNYLQEHLFSPLGMRQTTLGLGNRQLAETVPSQVTADPDWNWNSRYWRSLGAPWGGAIGSARDIHTLLQAFVAPNEKLLPAALAQKMIKDQNAHLNQSWGIGFAVNARHKTGPFGLANSASAFGHGGSTGTLCWADPEKQTSLVLLTGKPAAESNKPVLQPLANLAAAISAT